MEIAKTRSRYIALLKIKVLLRKWKNFKAKTMANLTYRITLWSPKFRYFNMIQKKHIQKLKEKIEETAPKLRRYGYKRIIRNNNQEFINILKKY